MHTVTRLRLMGCVAVMAALLPLTLAAQPPQRRLPPEAPEAIEAQRLELESDFVVIAMHGDMVESAANTLALARASDARLRDFAAAMIADHDAMRVRFMRAARALHLPVPVTLGGRAQARLDRLEQTLDGDGFDDAYVGLMLRLQRETMAAHLYAAGQCRPGLAQASREVRLRLHDHLERLQELALELDTLAQDDPPPRRPRSPFPEDASD